jgi:beta-xylosidase
MGFVDAYPGGRVPVLAPITWDNEGWPSITTVNGGWGVNYPYPLSESPVQSPLGKDEFSGTILGPAWEWNHNPDTTAFSVNDGLTLSAVTVTDDLYNARNTLTKRIHGPVGTGTLEVDISNMASGDRAGLALLRDQSAYVGVFRNGDGFTVNYVDGLTMDDEWVTTGTGTVRESQGISAGTIWLRLVADIAPGGSHQASFHYSTDGDNFSQIGGAFTMNTNWQFFMGYRYGIFEFATESLGGSIAVKSFTSEA